YIYIWIDPPPAPAPRRSRGPSSRPARAITRRRRCVRRSPAYASGPGPRPGGPGLPCPPALVPPRPGRGAVRGAAAGGARGPPGRPPRNGRRPAFRSPPDLRLA
ncbi:MAG: hypothetical protein ACK53Y_27205, partial [bacterium]